jgi:hypothetical protein
MEFCYASSENLLKWALFSIKNCTNEKTQIFDIPLLLLNLTTKMFISIGQQEGDNMCSFRWVMQSTIYHLVSWEHPSWIVQKLEHILNSPHYVWSSNRPTVAVLSWSCFLSHYASQGWCIWVLISLMLTKMLHPYHGILRITQSISAGPA